MGKNRCRKRALLGLTEQIFVIHSRKMGSPYCGRKPFFLCSSLWGVNFTAYSCADGWNVA
jgi:hypothetical protein